MPITRLLESMTDLENAGFIKRSPGDLQAKRHAVGANPTRQDERWQAGQIERLSIAQDGAEHRFRLAANFDQLLADRLRGERQ